VLGAAQRRAKRRWALRSSFMTNHCWMRAEDELAFMVVS